MSIEAIVKGLSVIVADNTPNLSARQICIVGLCYLEGAATVRGLAKRLNVAKPTISQAVNRLVSLGFVRKVVDVADRRSVFVYALPPGQEFLESLVVA